MVNWVVGLSTGSFYKLPIFDVLEPIRRGGFRLIEISGSRSHLDYHNLGDVEKAAKLIKQLSLDPFSYHAPFGELIDITSLEPREREDSIQEILASMETAALLGASHFLVHPGPDKERVDRGEHRERMRNGIESLRRISGRCSEKSMMLVLENLLPHLPVGRALDVKVMIRSLNPIKVGACLDTGHAYVSGDLPSEISEMAGHLVMVHANDNRGQRDDHLPPGRGKIDWADTFGALRRAGFQGPLLFELSGDGDGVETNLEEAQEALRFTITLIK